jgi:Casjensviridae DNA polymerase
VLHLDFESRSLVELRGKFSVGLWNYATHPSTQILMLAFAFDDGPVNIWFLGKPLPKDLKDALEDPKVEITAFNSAFERYLLWHKMGYEIPASRFQDPQASGRYLSLPASLAEQGEVLGLPPELQKDKRGEELIDLFSKPQRKKLRGQEPIYYFRNEETNPKEWGEFCEYCKQDVRAEREIIRRQKLLGAFPLPPLERDIWLLDQKINDRGMPTSREFATKGLRLAERDKEAQLQALNDLTGLDNANSRNQMLEWMQTQGYKENSLRKGAVGTTLKYKRDELTLLGIQALEARKAASSTSYQKMAAILRQICPDERLRNQFVYMGSPACGRWAGAGFQFHNQARPLEIFEDEEYLNWARAMIFAEDGDAIKSWFQSILLTVKSCIRTTFVAKSGKRLNVCDLNAIETRVGAWIAGCESLLMGFKTIKDFDPYLHFAARLLNLPYEDLIRDKKSKDPATRARIKRYRQFGKVGVLGAIYRLGGGDWGWKTNADGTKDRIKTGLWGFAEAMGIELTREEAHNIVEVFRKKAYPEIPQCWRNLEDAVKDVLGGVQTVRRIGPEGCIVIDKINLLDRNPILRVQLPSGRYLHYFDARIEEKVKMPYKHKEHDENGDEIEVDVYAPSFVYARQNQTTKQWDPWITSHGGKLFENIVQGIARDVLAIKLLAFEGAGMPVVGHVHDEGIVEGEDDPLSPGALDMELIMGEDIDWAPGLPLAAEGFESSYYRK